MRSAIWLFFGTADCKALRFAKIVLSSEKRKGSSEFKNQQRLSFPKKSNGSHHAFFKISPERKVEFRKKKSTLGVERTVECLTEQTNTFVMRPKYISVKRRTADLVLCDIRNFFKLNQAPSGASNGLFKFFSFRFHHADWGMVNSDQKTPIAKSQNNTALTLLTQKRNFLFCK